MMLTDMISWTTIVCYSLLYIAVLLLWFPCKLRIPAWSIVFGMACIFGLMSGQIEVYAIFVIILFTYAVQYTESQYRCSKRAFAGLIVCFLAYGLGAHKIPYFCNLKVLSDIYISKEAVPFTLYINFDKTVVGLLILGLTQRLLFHKKEWLAMLKQTLPKIGLLIILLVFFALIADKIRFDPKLPESLPIWLITNLLLVCTAEEGFFRGFIQKNLVAVFKDFRWGHVMAVIIASLLFGFAHYAGGISYSIWGTFAGLGYGWIYQKTNRIEASILAHFCLNLTHFLLFTYPALA